MDLDMSCLLIKVLSALRLDNSNNKVIQRESFEVFLISMQINIIVEL